MRQNTPTPPVDGDVDDMQHGNEEPAHDVDMESDDELVEVDDSMLEMLEAQLREEEGEYDAENVVDMACTTFTEHTGPVFGAALHKTLNVVVTGSEDDTVCLWNPETGALLLKLTEHKDTVTDVHISHDGQYLATGDMSGELFVHRFPSSTADELKMEKVWQYLMGDMTWMRWHRGANVLLAGSDSGEIYVWRIPGGDCKILPGEGVRCEAGELTSDGLKLLAGYANGHVRLWSLKTSSVIMEVNSNHPMAHELGVNGVACNKDMTLMMSGGNDGKVLFLSHTAPVGMVHAEGGAECVAFSPSSELKMAASGTLAGQVAIWDYVRFSLRILCNHPEGEGIIRLIWISDYYLLVSTIYGNIYCYDARTGDQKFMLTGHKSEVYELVYSAEKNLLLTTSEDHTAKIFKLPDLDH